MGVAGAEVVPYWTSQVGGSPIVFYKYQPSRMAEHAHSSLRAFPNLITQTATRATQSCWGKSGWLTAGSTPGGKIDEALNCTANRQAGDHECSSEWNIALSCLPGRDNLFPSEERTKQRLKEEAPILDALLA